MKNKQIAEALDPQPSAHDDGIKDEWVLNEIDNFLPYKNPKYPLEDVYAFALQHIGMLEARLRHEKTFSGKKTAYYTKQQVAQTKSRLEAFKIVVKRATRILHLFEDETEKKLHRNSMIGRKTLEETNGQMQGAKLH